MERNKIVSMIKQARKVVGFGFKSVARTARCDMSTAMFLCLGYFYTVSVSFLI